MQLVNARDVRNVPGRGKTDLLTELPQGFRGGCPVVSVSAIVEDFPHGSICHIPTVTTRRNRARARLESEPHERADCHSRVFAEYHPDRTTRMFSRITLNFRGSDTPGRTVKHEYIGTHCATTNFADNYDMPTMIECCWCNGYFRR